uniref:Chemokine interleukin-8-like domain-containing protein n=1 Tax=Malurus cyaneus samueli TaxID=2593467 RepID=A0A8C5TXP0_9PASS
MYQQVGWSPGGGRDNTDKERAEHSAHWSASPAPRVLFEIFISGQPKAPLKCSIVCTSFMPEEVGKRIRSKIRSYRWTEPACRKRAVIFITVKAKEMCAEPGKGWVEKIMEELNQTKATMSPLERDATSPEGPGSVERHVGLPDLAPSQATAPTSFFQGTGTTIRERIHAPAAGTEVSSKSPLGMQNPTQLPARSTPVIPEEAAHSEITPEAKRESLNSPAPSTTVAAGMDSSQPTPNPTAPVHGFSSTLGSTEEAVGHAADLVIDVQGKTSPNSNSDLMATTKGSDQPVLPTDGSLGPTSGRASTQDTASSSSRSDLSSIQDSVETTTVTLTAPQTTSVSALSSTTVMDKAASAHTSPSADVFGTRAVVYSSPVGMQEPSDTVVFTHQAFSGQARVHMITVRPNNRPLPSFLSGSQMHFIIPVSVVCGLTAGSVVLVWLYLKFGVKPEETSREMVQGLLYQHAGRQDNAYPMEVI